MGVHPGLHEVVDHRQQRGEGEGGGEERHVAELNEAHRVVVQHIGHVVFLKQCLLPEICPRQKNRRKQLEVFKFFFFFFYEVKVTLYYYTAKLNPL